MMNTRNYKSVVQDDDDELKGSFIQRQPSSALQQSFMGQNSVDNQQNLVNQSIFSFKGSLNQQQQHEQPSLKEGDHDSFKAFSRAFRESNAQYTNGFNSINMNNPLLSAQQQEELNTQLPPKKPSGLGGISLLQRETTQNQEINQVNNSPLKHQPKLISGPPLLDLGAIDSDLGKEDCDTPTAMDNFVSKALNQPRTIPHDSSVIRKFSPPKVQPQIRNKPVQDYLQEYNKIASPSERADKAQMHMSNMMLGAIGDYSPSEVKGQSTVSTAALSSLAPQNLQHQYEKKQGFQKKRNAQLEAMEGKLIHTERMANLKKEIDEVINDEAENIAESKNRFYSLLAQKKQDAELQNRPRKDQNVTLQPKRQNQIVRNPSVGQPVMNMKIANDLYPLRSRHNKSNNSFQTMREGVPPPLHQDMLMIQDDSNRMPNLAQKYVEGPDSAAKQMPRAKSNPRSSLYYNPTEGDMFNKAMNRQQRMKEILQAKTLEPIPILNANALKQLEQEQRSEQSPPPRQRQYASEQSRNGDDFNGQRQFSVPQVYTAGSEPNHEIQQLNYLQKYQFQAQRNKQVNIEKNDESVWKMQRNNSNQKREMKDNYVTQKQHAQRNQAIRQQQLFGKKNMKTQPGEIPKYQQIQQINAQYGIPSDADLNSSSYYGNDQQQPAIITNQSPYLPQDPSIPTYSASIKQQKPYIRPAPLKQVQQQPEFSMKQIQQQPDFSLKRSSPTSTLAGGGSGGLNTLNIPMIRPEDSISQINLNPLNNRSNSPPPMNPIMPVVQEDIELERSSINFDEYRSTGFQTGPSRASTYIPPHQQQYQPQYKQQQQQPTLQDQYQQQKPPPQQQQYQSRRPPQQRQSSKKMVEFNVGNNQYYESAPQSQLDYEGSNRHKYAHQNPQTLQVGYSKYSGKIDVRALKAMQGK